MDQYLKTDAIVVFAIVLVYYFGFLHGSFLKKYKPSKPTPPAQEK